MKDIHISDNKIFLQIRTSTTWFSFSTNLAHLAYPSMPLALSQTFQLLSPGETAQIVRSAFPQSVSLGFLRRGAQSLLSQDTLAGRIQQMLLERMPYCFCEFCGKSQKLIPGCVTLIKKKSLLLFLSVCILLPVEPTQAGQGQSNSQNLTGLILVGRAQPALGKYENVD